MTRLVVGVLTALTAGTLTAGALAAEARTKPTYRLQSGRKQGQIDRVVVLLEVGGDVVAKVLDKEDRQKTSVLCNLAYDERTLHTSTDARPGLRSVRWYDKAEAVVKVGKVDLKPTLRPQRRIVGAETDFQRVTMFSPHGPLTRDELELVDVLGNTLLLDRLLPQDPVAVGGSWEHPQKLLGGLLGLEAVAETDVQSTLSEVTDTTARMEMSGRVEGAVYGVSTEIELKAKYRLDRRTDRLDWFAMLVKEKRNASPVEDGMDVIARLQIQITPKTQSEHLSDASLNGLHLAPQAELEQLTYRPADGSWQLTYDRNWHVYGDRRDRVSLRLLDRGEFLTQCNVSTLLDVAPGKQPALARFQDDVKQALGESFGEFVEAGQRANAAGYREYRAVVRGAVRREIQEKVLEAPIQWHYYLLADRHGRQVLFAFSIECDLVDRLNEADRRLVDSLRFDEPSAVVNRGS